jgi:hypothetical protein
MTASDILRAAGWAPHPTLGYENGTLVHGIQPDGAAMHIKDWAWIKADHPQYSVDTPDTAEEAAAWLVARYRGAGVSQISTENEGGEWIGSLTSSSARSPADETNSDGVAPQQEAEAEPDSVAGDVADAYAGGAVVSLQSTPPIWPVDSDPIDADFGEFGELALALPAPESAVVEGGDAGEVPRLTEDIKDFAPDPIAAMQEAVAYYGDNLPMQRIVLIGRVTQIAREFKAALQADWTLDEFRNLQNLIVRIDRGEAPDNSHARARFHALSDASRAMSTIEVHAETQVAWIENAGRELLAVYDPELGWP